MRPHPEAAIIQRRIATFDSRLPQRALSRASPPHAASPDQSDNSKAAINR